MQFVKQSENNQRLKNFTPVNAPMIRRTSDVSFFLCNNGRPVNWLQAFRNVVNAQYDKKISEDDANILIINASKITNILTSEYPNANRY